MTDKTRYLRISGRLYPDHRLVLRPSYFSENPRDSVNVPESPLVVELHGDEVLLLRWGLRYPASVVERKTRPGGKRSSVRTLTGDEPSYMPVRAKVPFHPATKRILIKLRDVVLREIQVPSRGPVFRQSVRVTKTTKGYRFDWTTDHPDAIPVYYHVRMSPDEGKTWRRLAWRLDRPGWEVALDQLEGGEKCIVEVVAYDGVNTVAERTRVVDAPQASWDVSILSPRPSDRPLSPPIELRSWGALRVYDRSREQKPQCTWTANGQEIAQGPEALWEDVEPGEYEIVFRVRLGEQQAADSVRILVGSNNDRRK